MAENKETFKANEGEYFKVSTVYQAAVGHHHYGMWTSKEEAERHIKANEPDAKPFEGIPAAGLESLPEGSYFIMPRSVFSHTKPTSGK